MANELLVLNVPAGISDLDLLEYVDIRRRKLMVIDQHHASAIAVEQSLTRRY